MFDLRNKLTLIIIGSVAAFTVTACGTSADSAPSEDQSPNRQASQLLNDFWTAVKDADTDTLEETLSQSWQLARADGTNLSRKEYIDEIGQGEIDIVDFTFEQVNASRSGNSLVVRYVAKADYTLEGDKYKGDPASYLGTFVYQEDRWQMASQANFNVPVD
jgi:ketosteroid isomerase-like protein